MAITEQEIVDYLHEHAEALVEHAKHAAAAHVAYANGPCIAIARLDQGGGYYRIDEVMSRPLEDLEAIAAAINGRYFSISEEQAAEITVASMRLSLDHKTLANVKAELRGLAALYCAEALIDASIDGQDLDGEWWDIDLEQLVEDLDRHLNILEED